MFMKSHPKSLWVLSFGKMWDTFSYFGTQTILVLYFIKVFNLSRSESYLLYGAYAAFAFSTPILGGIIADKWLGSKQSIILGAVLNIVGNLLLISLHRSVFCLGLATSIIGSGLYKSNATHLVGTLYPNGNSKKEQAYTVFYLAINVGGTLAPIIYGLIAYFFNWNWVFLFSAFGISLGAVWVLKNWHHFKLVERKRSPLNTIQIAAIYISIFMACLLLGLTFYYPSSINPVIIVVFIVGILYLALSTMRYLNKARKRLWALLLLFFLALFYFSAGLQIGTVITLFIQHNINMGIIKMHLPASTFSMLYSLFVLLLAPAVTYLWIALKRKNMTLNTPSKVTIGIGLATLGIASFLLASLTNLILTGIILGYLLLSAGELVLSPSVYTTISDLAPEGMKSTMMGGWLFFIALGGYTSSLLANLASLTSKNIQLFSSTYSTEFFFITLFTLLVTIISALMIPVLTKMME